MVFSGFHLRIVYNGENHENDDWSEYSDFYKLTLYMIFENFHGKSHY